MAFSQGSSSFLSYIAESTYGTTPSTPAMKKIPFVSHSLNMSKTTIEGNTIRDDRNVPFVRHGNRQVGGDIEIEFLADDYDPFLESLLQSAFVGSTFVKNGVTRKYFSMEDGATDITQFRKFTGLSASSLSLNVQPNQIVTGSFGFIGKDMTQSSTSVDSSPDAFSTNNPFDSFSCVLQDNAVTLAIVSSISLTIENNLSPTFVIGAATAPFVETQRFRVSGSMTYHYEDATLINKFINETVTNIKLKFNDPDNVSGNDYEFFLPKVKLNSADGGVPNEQSRLITASFQAYYDGTEASTLKITKS